MPTENRSISTKMVSSMEIALAEFLRGKMTRLRNSYTRAFEAGWQARGAEQPADQHQGEPEGYAPTAKSGRLCTTGPPRARTFSLAMTSPKRN